ncbi:hypothetical protein ABEI56_17305 [Peribacillus castrilensis]|uniref:hypothetical protein n=1 Tax=Peribacillus castrilensis TaxID=2897690 RepID=UPI003D2B5D64
MNVKRGSTTFLKVIIFLAGIAVLAKVTGSDDAAGPTSLCLMGILATSIIAAIVDALQKPLKNALDIMSKNE